MGWDVVFPSAFTRPDVVINLYEFLFFCRAQNIIFEIKFENLTVEYG